MTLKIVLPKLGLEVPYATYLVSSAVTLTTKDKSPTREEVVEHAMSRTDDESVCKSIYNHYEDPSVDDLITCIRGLLRGLPSGRKYRVTPVFTTRPKCTPMLSLNARLIK